MVRIYLFCYSVKIRLRVRGSLIFCKNKNGVFTFIPFDPKIIMIVSEGVFVFLIWFCCNSQVVSRVFGYFNIHKLLFKFKGGRCVLRISQQVCSLAPFGWCMRCPNCTECCLSRRCLLHLATPITMVRRVFTVVTRKSIGH